MTTLNNTARTILRSRVRRHPDVDQHVPTGGVSALSNADLTQIGLLLGLDIPSDRAVARYQEAKGDGCTGKQAIYYADDVEYRDGTGGAGLARLAMLGSNSPASLAEPDDDADDAGADDNPPAATPDADAEPAHVIEARAKVKDIQALMGAGDFAGYSAALLDLAIEAFRPAPVVTRRASTAPIDPSKIKGHVPTITGAQTMAKAGIQALAAVTDAATEMPIYDAPDAPAVDPAYIWPDDTGPMLAVLSHGRNLMVYGPAGTGKTTWAEQVAANWGRPFVRISCDDQTEPATLVGMTVPSAGGGTEWRDGQLAAAIRRPGTVILIDEPTVARPGALMVLQAVMDDNRALHVPDTGEVIPVAPDVLFVLADNTNGTGDASGQYEATRILNRATLDRLSITVELSYMDAASEIRALQSRSGLDRKRAALLVKYATLTRSKAEDGHLSHGLGLRRLIALGELLTAGVSPDVAFRLAVLGTAPHDDREPLRQLWAAEVATSKLEG